MKNHDVPRHRYPETCQMRPVTEIQIIKMKAVKGGCIEGYRFHHLAPRGHEDPINGLHFFRRRAETLKPEDSRQTMRDAAMDVGLPCIEPTWPYKTGCAPHPDDIIFCQMLKQASGEIVRQDFNVIMGEDKGFARALREAAIIPLTQRFCVPDQDDFMRIPSKKPVVMSLNAR